MIYDKKTLNDIDFDGKTVIVRVDFNVPMNGNIITDNKRIVESLPTIKYLLERKTKIILLSHLGRVKSLDDISKKSLKPVYEHLKTLLPNNNIIFEENNTDTKLLNKIKNMDFNSIMILENTRFNDVDSKNNVVKKESGNNQELAKFWASLGDVFVNDAFGTSHRAHASNVGIANNIKESCIGFLIEKELKMLFKATNNPEKPLVAIFGGKKIKDKIQSIENISKIADYILIGGGMSYAFQKALGYNIGKSFYEEGTEAVAKELLEKYKDKLILPIDLHAGKEFSNDTKLKKFKISNLDPEYEGMDIGAKTIKKFETIIKDAKTIIWNGPLGVCEFKKFSTGTEKICKLIVKARHKNNAFTLIGGGDSAAAAAELGYSNDFSHISTGGGASIEFLEGKDLVGIVAIMNKNDIPRVNITNKKTPSKKPTKTTDKKTTKSTSKKPTKTIDKKSSKTKNVSKKDVNLNKKTSKTKK